ncbi:MAG: signal peptidase I [Clostridia bacterium]|nr:signal peptidase I [Clostridia bacterium]
MIKILKKIDYVILILILLFILALYGVFQIKIQKHGYVNYFGYTFFQVITGSMEPTIKVKDIVVEKITKDVSIDNIITYKYNDDYVTHRVIKRGGNFVVTKGDNNNDIDEPVLIDNVVGKVIFIIPNVAIWIKVITTPQVVAIVVLALIIFRILFYKDIKPRDKD